MHTTKGKIVILGINGHIGRPAAEAFVAAGWDVTGFGRSLRMPIAGVRFVKGDAENVDDLRAAIGDADVVLDALNLRYDTWDKGRMEAQKARVIEAMGRSGKTLLFPGNIYNYAASDREITPDLPQRPETPRGEIRVRTEALLEQAAARGDVQVIILRAGDFFGPDCSGDWFDLVMLREAGKGRLAVMGAPGVGHAWAYLPDLGRAFEKLAWHRQEFGRFERLHFAGHFVTQETLRDAILKASPKPLKQTSVPWFLLSLIGLGNGVIREVVKMRYLWENPMRLKDVRLDTILGEGFGTPFDEAVASRVRQEFEVTKVAA